MYKIQVARVKLSNLISKSKFINTNQMSIHFFPVMHLYALHLCLLKLWCFLASSCYKTTPHNIFLNVLLTVHIGTTLGKWPTWCKITLCNTFIIIILYMFRATLCSSSGGQIVLIQHLIYYSLQVTVPCAGCTCTLDRCKCTDAVLIQFDLLMMSTELLKTCRGL